MRSDGKFTLREFVIEKWEINRPLSLIPFGDVHRDSPAHSSSKWEEFLAYAKTKPDAVFLGMGDYFDSFSTSERILMSNPLIHDSSRQNFESAAKLKISEMSNELMDFKGRFVGLLSGNHFVQFADGTNSDMRLAGILETEYLGVCSAIRIVFRGLHGTCTVSVDVFAHHGKGGGQTAGGRLNAVEKLAQIAEADIFLMGDNHARGAIPIGDKLRIVGGGKNISIRSRQSWIGRTGSFLKAYEPGEVSYVVDRALQPSNLGWIEFILTPRRSRDEGEDRMTVDIGSIQ